MSNKTPNTTLLLRKFKNDVVHFTPQLKLVMQQNNVVLLKSLLWKVDHGSAFWKKLLFVAHFSSPIQLVTQHFTQNLNMMVCEDHTSA